MRIIVIGAGVIGLTTAWTLHHAGADVTIVDPAPAAGATHAAAGMLAPVAETYYREQELGRLCLAAAAIYPSFIAELAARLGRDTAEIGYRPTRTLIVGADSADRSALSDLHELSVSLGLASERLTTREARRLEPLLSPTLACAFLADGDHQVDPRALAAALLEALAAGGAPLVTCEAESVTHAGDDHSRVTGVRLGDGGHIDADVVVVANAVAARDLRGLGVDLSRSLRPVYGDILRVRPPRHLHGLLTGTVRGLAAGRAAYLVPRGDGEVVLGATSREDGNDQVSAGGVHELLRDAIRLVPAVAEFALAESVARARPGTPDNAPLLGRLPAPGLIAATGTFRNGVLLAPAVGQAVAGLVGLGEALDLTAFDPTRFCVKPSSPVRLPALGTATAVKERM